MSNTFILYEQVTKFRKIKRADDYFEKLQRNCIDMKVNKITMHAKET